MDDATEINSLGATIAKYMLNVQAGQRPIKRAHLRAQILPESSVKVFESVIKAANTILAPLRYEIQPLKIKDIEESQTKKDPEYTIVSTLPPAHRKFVSEHLPQATSARYGLLLFILGCVILSGPNGLTEDQLVRLLEHSGLGAVKGCNAAIKFSLDQKFILRTVPDGDQAAANLIVGPRARQNVSPTTMLNQLKKMLWPLSSEGNIPPDELEHLKKLLTQCGL